MIKLTVEKENGLPLYTRCSVCHQVYINGIGSTPCCGGFNDYLFEHEVVELGIDINQTRNKGVIPADE